MIDGVKPFTDGKADEVWSDVVALHSVTSQGRGYPTLLAHGPVKTGSNPHMSIFKMSEQEVRSCLDSLNDPIHKQKVDSALPEGFLSTIKELD